MSQKLNHALGRWHVIFQCHHFRRSNAQRLASGSKTNLRYFKSYHCRSRIHFKINFQLIFPFDLRRTLRIKSKVSHSIDAQLFSEKERVRFQHPIPKVTTIIILDRWVPLLKEGVPLSVEGINYGFTSQTSPRGPQASNRGLDTWPFLPVLCLTLRESATSVIEFHAIETP